jgi:hypothetical protein
MVLALKLMFSLISQNGGVTVYQSETRDLVLLLPPSYNKIQFNVAIRNNFVVIESLSFSTQAWISARFSIFLNFDILFFKILHNKHNAAHNLAQCAFVNMCLVSHTRALMFLGRL